MLKGTHISEEHRRKLIGRHLTEETRQKLSIIQKGKHLSEITKQRMSIARKGHLVSEETRKKIGLGHIGLKGRLGQKNTEEHNRKISLANLGKKHPGRKLSEETKRKIGLANTIKSLGNKSHFGCKHTLEARQKMSLALKGKKRGNYSPEWRNSISLALKGRHLSESTKKKIGLAHLGKSAGMLGKHHSEETKQKLRGHTKEKSSNWHGGLSFEPYTTDWRKSLKRSIRERDHYTCQICGALQSEVAFPVHHIDYNKKNCSPSNLITLCKKCHGKTNINRQYWAKTLYIRLLDCGVIQ